jgi:hypothetical protein
MALRFMDDDLKELQAAQDDIIIFPPCGMKFRQSIFETQENRIRDFAGPVHLYKRFGK